MGFTTGFIGGVTLTYSILYLSIYLHKANRNVQHTLLSQQSLLLNSVFDPLPPPPEPPGYEVRKDSMVEMMKDRWNSEVEGLVRRTQETDWNEVRERWQNRASNVFAKLRESDTGKGLEGRFKENVVGTADDVKKGASSSSTGGPRLLELK